MPFFGFYFEPVRCATEALGPTAERQTTASTARAAGTSATTTTEWASFRLLRSRRPPPTPDGTAATSAAREASHAAAREAAAAAAANTTAAEPASAAVDAQASKVAAEARATTAAVAAQAVGLEPAATTELKGKYLALFFGASWCPHCRTFATRLHQVYSQLQHLQDQQQPRFEAVYIPCDRSPVEFAAFAYTMPWLSLPFGDYSALIRRYGVRSLPSVIIIRPDDQVLLSDAVPIINDRDAAQKLQNMFERFGPFESSYDRYKTLFGMQTQPKPSSTKW
ncbi:uncharacterized protein EMH_0018020 [Eimeria mitis]|uniref:protein-disulfide reductase n=1 Tax=Eimeria mitis TaxID=44415 RepID=U6KI66_9EIME|nr:uncharacterized protein EMH_0018020 [Eimeria mitis]CDJ35932.1 hypothetical protein, conserved [Eimeria mitis]